MPLHWVLTLDTLTRIGGEGLLLTNRGSLHSIN